MKIIDAHVHIVQTVAGFTSRGELRATGKGMATYADGTSFMLIPPEVGEYDATPEKILEVMDKNCVEKAVLLQGQFYGFQNEYTATAIKKYPNRFTGAASYDPFCKNVESVKRRLFVELGFKAVKFEMSNGSGLCAYHDINLNGEVMNSCYRHADENGLTVVMDIGRPNNECWQIENLAAAIKKYPQTTFVICHLLSPQRGDSQLLKQSLSKLCFGNVYFDLSSLAANQKPEKYPYPSAVKHLRVAKETVGAEKLMFGSDMPSNLCKDSYANLKNYITESGVFSQSELESIFYKNANKVYFSNSCIKNA